MRVLVTGASGFVGRGLVKRFAADGHEVFAAGRAAPSWLPPRCTFVPLTALEQSSRPLTGPCAVDVVVHSAARVHVMQETAGNSLALFRAVNVEGSLALARQTHAAGARRFIYLSSVKVLGESSQPGWPLTVSTTPAPADAYSQSKLEAEHALTAFCAGSGMELVVVRPPLVYGPGVKANFERLMRAVAQRRPLPFGRLTENRRSLVALGNLVDLVSVCAFHSAAAGRTFLVSDGEDLSTAELVRRLARALGVRPRLLPVPLWALRIAGTLFGRRDAVERLCGSLQVDIRDTRAILSWAPTVTVDEGLVRAAAPLLAAN